MACLKSTAQSQRTESQVFLHPIPNRTLNCKGLRGAPVNLSYSRAGTSTATPGRLSASPCLKFPRSAPIAYPCPNHLRLALVAYG